MELCVKDIRTWMIADKLKMNEKKTEFMIIGTKLQLEKVNIDHLMVGSSRVSPVPIVKNLGTWFDSNLNLREHINKTCRAGHFQLHKIKHTQKYLSDVAARTLVHAFIIGRIDYCSSLLYGLPSVHLNKLQRVQNSAARLICNISRYEHITPVLHTLHWLPVQYRVNFKVLMLAFKTIHGLAPDYISDLICIRDSHLIVLDQIIQVYCLHSQGPNSRKHWETDHLHLLPQNCGTCYHLTLEMQTVLTVLKRV